MVLVVPSLLMEPAGGIREEGAEELGPEWLGGLVVMCISTFCRMILEILRGYARH